MCLLYMRLFAFLDQTVTSNSSDDPLHDRSAPGCYSVDRLSSSSFSRRPPSTPASVALQSKILASDFTARRMPSDLTYSRESTNISNASVLYSLPEEESGDSPTTSPPVAKIQKCQPVKHSALLVDSPTPNSSNSLSNVIAAYSSTSSSCPSPGIAINCLRHNAHPSKHDSSAQLPACNHHLPKIYTYSFDGTKRRSRFPLVFSDSDVTAGATPRHKKRRANRAFRDETDALNNRIPIPSIKAS